MAIWRLLLKSSDRPADGGMIARRNPAFAMSPASDLSALRR
jgi:hypothetical protein